jgi:hypothetical protein
LARVAVLSQSKSTFNFSNPAPTSASEAFELKELVEGIELSEVREV